MPKTPAAFTIYPPVGVAAWDVAQQLADRPDRLAASRLDAAKGTAGLTSLISVGETEPNDTIGTAEPMPLGFELGEDIAVDVTGSLGSPLPPTPISSVEDDGSIPLANATGLLPGASVVASGTIGDGPFGGTSGDYDFYGLSALAGATITIDVNAESLGSSLDSFVGIYNSSGALLADNDDSVGTFDSLLNFTTSADDTYFIVVRGFGFGFQSDPFDSSSGGGASSTGFYQMEIGLDAGDVDFFALDLAAGDILGANVAGGATHLTLRDSSGMQLVGSPQDLSFIFPAASPLPGGGNASLAWVVDSPGSYTVAVDGGVGQYDLNLRIFRPTLELQERLSHQTLFLDFDGETLDMSIFGSPGTRSLSPLSTFLSGWGLDPGDESAVIDAIVATVEENFADVGLLGNNGDFVSDGVAGHYGIEILNSRDHAEPFGLPNISRVIVGGTIAESGIGTIGIAESIDVGNFETAESGLVLLDLLSGPATGPSSLNQYALGAGATKIDLVGVGVGNIVAHEAGHFFANWHTNQFNAMLNIMDQGGNLDGKVGVGPNGIFEGGAGDDEDVDFGRDTFVSNEGFTGTEDTLNAIAFGLSTGTVDPGMIVVGTSPAEGDILFSRPTDFVFDFLDPYDPATVDAADLTINGIPADAVLQSDPDTLTFQYTTSPVTVDGLQTIKIAAGAVERASDAEALQAFDASFRYDSLLMEVVSTEPALGPLVELPLDSLLIHFNEPYDPATIGTDDLVLSRGEVVGFTVVDAVTVQYTMDGVDREGTLTLVMEAGAVTDTFGGPGAAFSVSFDLDYGVLPLPAPLEQARPLGSLIHTGEISGTISVDDIDSFVISVDPGQTITVVVDPAAELELFIELRDASGRRIASDAGDAGEDVVLQTFATDGRLASRVGLSRQQRANLGNRLMTNVVPEGAERPNVQAKGSISANHGSALSQSFIVTVGGLRGSVGDYTVQFVLNATVEQESHDGPTNDTPAEAQDLEPSFISLLRAANANSAGASPERGAVLGSLSSTPFFIADFESGDDGFTVENIAAGLWHRSVGRGSEAGHSPTHSFYYGRNETPDGGGSYETGTRNVGLLVSPNIALPDTDIIKFDFNYILQTERNPEYDFAQLQINAGSDWTTLASYNAIAESENWSTADSVDLSVYAGQDVQFRWLFDTVDDVFNSFEGWYVDDVRIQVSELDHYTFSLQAGQSATVVLTGASGRNGDLRLLDPSGTVVAPGRSGEGSVGATITNFVARETGMYQIQIAGLGDYSLVVTRNAEFSNANNNDIDSAQEILSPQVAGRQWVLGHVDAKGGVLYGSDRDGQLFTIDVTTGAGEFVGNLPIATTEIEVSNISGRAFAQARNGGFFAHEFDIDTAAGIGGPISNGGAFNGLEYVGPTLYGTVIVGPGGPSQLSTLEPSTGSSTLIGPTGFGPIAGLAFDESAGVMYGISGGRGSANLYTIDLTTGTATIVGSTGFQAGSLQFGTDGLLYGGGTGVDGGDLFRIDPATGASDLVGVTGFSSVTGLTLRRDFLATGITDFYSVELVRGQPLELETFTPAAGSGEFVNGLDPMINLYDAAGNLVAANDNFPPDGRNARLMFNVPRGGEGTFFIEVAASGATVDSTSGEYVLTIKGATGALPTFEVAAINPLDGFRSRETPTQLTLDFSDAVFLPSLQASDVTVDGLPAVALTIVDGDTATFDLPALGEGVHHVSIGAGAIENLQAAPIAAFTSTFSVDRTSPRIIASSVLEGDVVPAGTLAYTVQFDEPLDVSSFAETNVSLVGLASGTHTPAVFDYDSTTSNLTVVYANLPEDDYTLRLLNSGAAPITAESEPNDDGVVGVSVADLASANDLSGSFVPVGGNDFQAVLTGQISAGDDLDFFKILASPGDILLVAMDGNSLGDPLLELFDNTGTLIAFDDDGGSGLNSLLFFNGFGYAGDFYVVADSFGSSVGTYTLTATLTTPNLLGDGRFKDLVGNVLDGEPDPLTTVPSGDGNPGGDFVINFSAEIDVMPFPTPLEAKRPLGSLIYDLSVSAVIGIAGDTDRFTLEVDPGQTMTVVVRSDAGLQAAVTLADPLGVLLAGATSDRDTVLQTVPATTGGTYSVTVGGPSGRTGRTGGYTVQLILNAAVERENHGGPSNGTVDTAQQLDSSFISLLPGVTGEDSPQRGAVLGRADGFIDHFSESRTRRGFVFFPFTHTFTFQDAPAPSAGGMLRVSAIADLGAADEFLTLDAEGIVFEDLFVTGGAEQSLVTTDILLTQPQLEALAADGRILLSIAPSSAVESLGPTELTVELFYPTGEDDLYSFTLNVGQSATLALTSLAGGTVELQLEDAAGTLLAMGAQLGTNVDAAISNFVAPEAGTYFARVAGPVDADYSLLVTRNAVFDIEPNDGRASEAQDMTLVGTALGSIGGGGSFLIIQDGSTEDSIEPLLTARGHSVTLSGGIDADFDGSLDLSSFDAVILVDAMDFSFGMPTSGQLALKDYVSAGGGLVLTEWIAFEFFEGRYAQMGELIPARRIAGALEPDTYRVRVQHDITDGLPEVFTIPTTGLSRISAVSGTVLVTGFEAQDALVIDTFGSGRIAQFAMAGNYLDFLPFDQGESSANLNQLFSQAAEWVAQSGAGSGTDVFSINVGAGNSLSITTATPADGPGEFGNELDPHVELYDPSGRLVAVGVPLADGRNEEITHTALVTGQYYVRLVGENDTEGEYVLNVSGHTGSPLALDEMAGGLVDEVSLSTAAIQTTEEADSVQSISRGQLDVALTELMVEREFYLHQKLKLAARRTKSIPIADSETGPTSGTQVRYGDNPTVFDRALRTPASLSTSTRDIAETEVRWYRLSLYQSGGHLARELNEKLLEELAANVVG